MYYKKQTKTNIMKTFETKTFKELGLTESYVRSARPNGWSVCQDDKGNKFAVRKL